MSKTAQTLTVVIPLARAFRWRRMLESGRFGMLNEQAAAEKISSSYVSRVLRLTLLAPDIVEAILDGWQPEGMTLAEADDELSGRVAEAGLACRTNPSRVPRYPKFLPNQVNPQCHTVR